MSNDMVLVGRVKTRSRVDLLYWESGVGTIPIKVRRLEPQAWEIVRNARKLISERDERIFGEDARWLWASTPKKQQWGKIIKYASQIAVDSGLDRAPRNS